MSKSIPWRTVQPPRIKMGVDYESNRETSHKRGYGANWQRMRAIYLKANPVCIRCGAPSRAVDHVTPHRGDYRLYYDTANWQAMCLSCHARKTNLERRDGNQTERTD